MRFVVYVYRKMDDDLFLFYLFVGGTMGRTKEGGRDIRHVIRKKEKKN